MVSSNGLLNVNDDVSISTNSSYSSDNDKLTSKGYVDEKVNSQTSSINKFLVLTIDALTTSILPVSILMYWLIGILL